MGEWITLLLQILQISGKLFDLFKEKNDTKIQQKQGALNDAIKGVGSSDTKAITMALDSYNSIK